MNSATEDFNKWCETELRMFSTDVDGEGGRGVSGKGTLGKGGGGGGGGRELVR